MSIKIVPSDDKDKFDRLSQHPLQSWAWGQFRQKTGIEVVRLGKYEKSQLTETAQVTIHPIPFTSRTVGYLPKGSILSQEMLKALIEFGNKYRCIFIKLEPNINQKYKSKFLIPSPERSRRDNSKFLILNSPHPLFTKYTFQLDLTKTEDELLKAMHHKTRYNIKVAQKHGVTVQEDNSERAFENYLRLTFETTKRQKFFAHDRRYHKLMWETLKPAGIAYLLTAIYRPQYHLGSDRLERSVSHDSSEVKESNMPIILVAWIVFLFNNILYYPYGASSSAYRNLMASNLIMWEVIKFGKKHGAKMFDMWGSLGPEPDSSDPWYGFHRFKERYGAQLTEFAGSFDLVINPQLYRLYNYANKGREIFLKIKAHIK